MKHETTAQVLAISVDSLNVEVEKAFEDDVITPDERTRIRWHVGLLRLRAEGHATRVRLGMRLIAGGICDREMVANVRSYGRWTQGQRERLNALQSIEADELAA